MFEKLDNESLDLIYSGLKRVIESGEGKGFHNGDMGHPVYVLGSTGDTETLSHADTPEKNRLFKMLSEISTRLKSANDGVDRYDFSTWQNFCKFALECKKKKK